MRWIGTGARQRCRHAKRFTAIAEQQAAVGRGAPTVGLLLRCTLTAVTLADAMDLMKAEGVEIGQDSLRMLAS